MDPVDTSRSASSSTEGRSPSPSPKKSSKKHALAWLEGNTSQPCLLKVPNYPLSAITSDQRGHYFYLTQEGRVFLSTSLENDLNDPRELALACQCVINMSCYQDCLYFVSDRGKVFRANVETPEKLEQVSLLKSPPSCCSHGFTEEGERICVKTLVSNSDHVLCLSENGQVWYRNAHNPSSDPLTHSLTLPPSLGHCLSLVSSHRLCLLLCESHSNIENTSSSSSSTSSSSALFVPDKCPINRSSLSDTTWLFASNSKSGSSKSESLTLLPVPSALKSSSELSTSTNGRFVGSCPHCRQDKGLSPSKRSSQADSTLELETVLETEGSEDPNVFPGDSQNATVLKEVWSRMDSLVRQSSTALFPNTDVARQFLSKQLSAMQMDEETRDILKENVNHVASMVAQSVKNVGEHVHRLSKHWSASNSTDADSEPEYATDAVAQTLVSTGASSDIISRESESDPKMSHNIAPKRWSNQESPSCLSLDSYVAKIAQKQAKLSQSETNPESHAAFVISASRQLSTRGFRKLDTSALTGSFREGAVIVENSSSITTLNQRGVFKVVMGKEFFLALSLDGTAYLGTCPVDGKVKVEPFSLPVRPEARVTFRDVAAGESHALLLTDKGDVFFLRPDKSQCVRLDTPVLENQRVTSVLAAGRLSCTLLEEMEPNWNNFLVSERLFLHSLLAIWHRVVLVLPKASPSDTFDVRGALFESYKHILGLVTENVARLTHGQAAVLHWAEPVLASWRNYVQSVCNALVMNGFHLNKSDSSVVEQAWPHVWPLLLDTQLRKTSSPFQVLMVEPLNRLKAYGQFLRLWSKEHHLGEAESERWKSTGEKYEAAVQANERECQLADLTRAFWDLCPTKLTGNLATPQRRLLRESRSQPLYLHQARSLSSHWFILLSDILVHAQYSTHVTYALETLWVEPLPDLETSNIKANALSLLMPEESLIVTCPTAIDKVEWFLALQAAIKACLGDKREGVSRPSPPLARHASYTFTKGTYKDAVYSGIWLCGKLQGQGELRWPDGRCYKGQFRQGLRHGLGRLDTPTPSGTIVYEGQWKDDRQSGYAVLQYASGDVYEGYFKDGLPQGHGSLKKGHLLTSAASVYVGEWDTGLRQGYGVLDDISAGEKYMGMWFADGKHGPAVVVTLDGLYMEGTFQNNKMIGEALLLFEDGSSYEGEVSSPGVFSGKGVLQWPHGDRLEGAFTGAWSDGIRVNGVLHKAVAPSSMCSSADRFSFGGHQLPNSLGQLCVPAHRKWESLFRHGYQVLGLPYPCYSPINPTLTVQAWDQVAVLISQAKNLAPMEGTPAKAMGDFRANLTRVRRGSGSAGWTHKWREWSKAERLEGLEKIPQCARTSLNYAEYQEAQAYLVKAFDCPLHPLGRLLCHLVDVYRATYVGIGAHARLLSQAVAEVRSILSRLYGLVRVLFPALPIEGQPLTVSSETEEVVTASSLLFPFLLPRLYPPLFTLYALANEKADELYWDRLVKWNRQGDLALFAFLGIDPKFWSPVSPNEEQRCELHFDTTVETLQQLSTTFCPQEKLLVIQNTFQEINKAVQTRLGPNYLWTMDDLFPIFQFVVVRARIRHLGSEIHLMDDLMEKHVQLGELGIMFTTLKACYFQIQHEKMNFS